MNANRTPTIILASADEFADFLETLGSYKIARQIACHGEYTSRCGYAEEGIFLGIWFVGSELKPDQHPYIAVAYSPSNEIASDELESLQTVWHDGEWLRRGPWEERIVRLLATLIRRIEKIDADQQRKQDKFLAKSAERSERETERLKRNWS